MNRRATASFTAHPFSCVCVQSGKPHSGTNGLNSGKYPSISSGRASHSWSCRTPGVSTTHPPKFSLMTDASVVLRRREVAVDEVRLEIRLNQRHDDDELIDVRDQHVLAPPAGAREHAVPRFDALDDALLNRGQFRSQETGVRNQSRPCIRLAVS